MSDTVVLYAPALEAMARALAASLGAAGVCCTADVAQCPADGADGSNSVAVFWDTFPSASSEKDPNVKVLHTALIDKHVVLLLSQDDTSSAFAQLSLVLWLQRFVVPKPLDQYASGKWKDTVPDGAFTVASVKSLSIVIPWYRYCQMERTSVRRRARARDRPRPTAHARAAPPPHARAPARRAHDVAARARAPVPVGSLVRSLVCRGRAALGAHV